MSRRLTVQAESFPVDGKFTISRGSRREVCVVVACIGDAEGFVGRGECVPYPRYGQSVPGVVAELEACAPRIAAGLDRHALQDLLPAGPARNALDCAFWDLEAKRSGVRVWQLAGLAAPRELETAYTISLDAPEVMAEAARRARARPLLKVKLGAQGDAERMVAVREAAPDARLIVDANEGWNESELLELLPVLARLGVELVEQPLPAAEDACLAALDLPVPLCADESCHDRAGLAELRERYAFVNLKLDKTGGLSEALRFVAAAKALEFELMLGCMVGTSLSMAPATLLGGLATFVDLDGPLLLAHDREPGLRYANSVVSPPDPQLWG